MKKLFTKITSLLLVLVMMFGITACGGSGTGNGGITDDGGEELPTDSEGNVIVADDEMITDEQAKAIEDAGIERVYIRTVIQCHAKNGICAHCYGADLASGNLVKVGEAVGIIAAQSIGEPGTQLTMRTFHSGGVA